MIRVTLLDDYGSEAFAATVAGMASPVSPGIPACWPGMAWKRTLTSTNADDHGVGMVGWVAGPDRLASLSEPYGAMSDMPDLPEASFPTLPVGNLVALMFWPGCDRGQAATVASSQQKCRVTIY